MCGRFAITLPPEAMRRVFGYEERPIFPPRYNIAPTQPVPIVRASTTAGIVSRHFSLARWAFLPAFVKDPKDFPLIFNARAESLGERATFRNAFRRRRCLVPADAFYEWHRTGIGGTVRARPYLCERADGTPLALAGLWETWHGPHGEEVDTACIITTGANGVSIAIHPRLPAIIEPAAFATWLDPDERTVDGAAALLKPPNNDVLRFVPIGDAVNKAANDGPEVMLPTGPTRGAESRSAMPAEMQPSLF